MSRCFQDMLSCSEGCFEYGNGRLGSGSYHAALDEFGMDECFVRVVFSLNGTFLRGWEATGFVNCYK